MKRRDVLVGAGAVTLSSVAGCLGYAGLDEHEASPAGVEPDVREETGYPQTNIEEIVIEETFEVGGTSEKITVRNYRTDHEKTIDLGPLGSARAAAFVLLTSPQISIAGQEMNPINEMSAEELVDMLEADFDTIEDVQHVTDNDVTVLDQETTESIFEAEAEVQATTVDVNIHVTESVETDEDHLVTIGVYPKQLEGTEADNIGSLRDGIVPAIE